MGWAIKRTLIGSNEFYIVGPKEKPAGISKASSSADAYRKIAKTEAKFFSRRNNSGTHKKEMAVWKNAGIQPSGFWYVITKDFMMATLKRADKQKACFMTDSSAFVAAQRDLRPITVLFRGDPFLIIVYHALCHPRGQHLDRNTQPFSWILWHLNKGNRLLEAMVWIAMGSPCTMMLLTPSNMNINGTAGYSLLHKAVTGCNRLF